MYTHIYSYLRRALSDLELAREGSSSLSWRGSSRNCCCARRANQLQAAPLAPPGASDSGEKGKARGSGFGGEGEVAETGV